MSYSATLISAADATSSLNGGIFDLGDLDGYSMDIDFSGANLAGTLTFEVGNSTTNLVSVPTSSQAVTSAASHLWNVTGAQYRYVRPVWTFSSGTGTITSTIYVKERLIKGA